MNMRIYADGNMINIDVDGGARLYDEPKGSISVCIVNNNRFQFYSKSRNQYLTAPLLPSEVRDSTGAVYGVTFDAVRTAINSFLGGFFFDLTTDDVINESDVLGTTATDAFNNIQADLTTAQNQINTIISTINSLGTNDIENDSNLIPGATATDALDYLYTNKLQWQEASVQSTGLTNVFILTLLAANYSANSVVVIWGKVYAKEPTTNNFYAGTFTAVTYINGTQFVAVTATVQQTVEDNFPVNPSFTKGVSALDFTLRCNSGLAGRVIDWRIQYLIDVKLMP